MPKRIKIGDIIEIPTNKGFAYAQYTHQNELMGALIRVFTILLKERPKNIPSLADGKVSFSIFFPVSAAVNRGIFDIVGHAHVSSKNKEFPLFRSGNANPSDKNDILWWLWDGEKTWEIGRQLTDEQKKLDIRGIWNDTLLVERIETGWTPEVDF